MTGSTFLTPEEVCELTGVRVGRAGKSREQLQVASLRTSGIQFWTNARGRPIIASAAIEGQRAMIGQGKTGQKLRIEVVGELRTVVDRIRARKVRLKVVSTALVINEKGESMTLGALQKRFSVARARAGVPVGDFQFRDLRAKAGTDKTDSSGDIREAQRQLGHKSLTMTEHYVGRRSVRRDECGGEKRGLRKTTRFAEKILGLQNR